MTNRRTIGPLAHLGTDRREDILRRLRLADDAKLVLVSLGGIPTHIDINTWPRPPGVYWIVPASWQAQHDHAIVFEYLDMHFVDVLRSSDALITKPGYGSFAEAACNGRPVLYVPRHDWPEEPYLVEWFAAYGRCMPIDRIDLEHGRLAPALERLFNQPKRTPPIPTGINEAVDTLIRLFEIDGAQLSR